MSKIDWTKKGDNRGWQNSLSTMDCRDPSDEDETPPMSAVTEFDESILVRNAEEIESPVHRRPSTIKKSIGKMSSDQPYDTEINSPREKTEYQR